MHKISAEFEIVTPMFLGGADQTEQLTQIRPPSVKGALRFWWRALQWSQFRSNAKNDNAAMQKLHDEEARLFGAAANENDKKLGQSLFNLRIKTKHLKNDPCPSNLAGLQYMLGQGLGGRKSFIGSFTVHLIFKPETEEKDQQSVVEALMVWGLLGGLGARSRRGLGSVAIRKITGCDLHIPQSGEQITGCLQNLFGKTNNEQPPYSAFSSMSRIDLLPNSSKQSPLNFLNHVGIEMLRYRSYGSRKDYNNPKSLHMVAGEVARPSFIHDHDDILGAVKNGNLPPQAPERGIFSFPHNYFFKSIYDSELERLKNQRMDEKKAKKLAKQAAEASLAPEAASQTR